jgi:Icc-related predicted phosphoesterase
MKFNIMSDVHNEFSVLPIPQTEADVVILAGDIHLGNRAIDWAQQFEKPIIYVMGNHEYYKGHFETVNQRIKEAAVGTNINVLDNDEVVIQGVRFIGGTLWTDFNLFGESRAEFAKLDANQSMSDYRIIRVGPNYRRLHPRDTIYLHEKTVSFLKAALDKPFSGKTVVVTHHAPSKRSVHPRYEFDSLTPAYASDLEAFMSEKIVLWVHGHMHNSNDYVLNGTRIVSNPRGYQYSDDKLPENRDFKPDLIVEI